MRLGTIARTFALFYLCNTVPRKLPMSTKFRLKLMSAIIVLLCALVGFVHWVIDKPVDSVHVIGTQDSTQANVVMFTLTNRSPETVMVFFDTLETQSNGVWVAQELVSQSDHIPPYSTTQLGSRVPKDTSHWRAQFEVSSVKTGVASLRPRLKWLAEQAMTGFTNGLSFPGAVESWTIFSEEIPGQ